MESLKAGGNMLCKKISEILTKSESSMDVVQEVIHFYSRTQHFCSDDINSSVSCFYWSDFVMEFVERRRYLFVISSIRKFK